MGELWDRSCRQIGNDAILRLLRNLPRGCAAILWNDPKKVEQASNELKITPDDLLAHGLDR